MGHLNADVVGAFMASHFENFDRAFRVDAIHQKGAVVTMRFHPRQLRPGGTIAGPTMMTLADTAGFIAMLGQIGLDINAVTTQLNIHFLQRPPPADLEARATIRKLGKRSAMVAVGIYSEGNPAPVADATVSYALPSSVKDSTP